MIRRKASSVIAFIVSTVFLYPVIPYRTIAAESLDSVVATGAVLEKMADGFMFTEGPAVDYNGNVYFSDVRASIIYLWSVDGALSTFRENTEKANGLYFDAEGNLIACAGGARSVVSYDPDGGITTIADRYDGKRLNMPNDIWAATSGGLYFTDPNYSSNEMEVDGEHVYYITPDRQTVIKVIGNLVKPNGIVGNPLTGVIYVIDSRQQKTFAYTIESNGMLSGERLFAEEGRDGMTVDVKGNVYITSREGVSVYSSSGERLGIIEVPESTTNVCIGGIDHRTLFITTGSSLYSIPLKNQGFIPENFMAVSEIDE